MRTTSQHPPRLDARAEWVTAGGFHALCAQQGLEPRIASLITRRTVDANGQPGWWRMRIQGTAFGPARWMMSWMPGAWWDAKFAQPAASQPDTPSFVWASHQIPSTTLQITRWWGTFWPGPGSPCADWGPVLPAFRQQVRTADGIEWELAWGICHPDHWSNLPEAGRRQDFVWHFTTNRVQASVSMETPISAG